MPSTTNFQIEVRDSGGKQTFFISGVIDENSDLSPLQRLTAAEVELNMRGVRRINSFGVRAWVDVIRSVPSTTHLVFVECPSPVIDQCNMVGGFLGHGALRSFYAPLICEECDEQVDQLFATQVCRELGGKLPAVPCDRCGEPMEVDDLEEQYLLFLREEVKSLEPAP